MQADMRVLRLDDGEFLARHRGRRRATGCVSHLDMYKVGRDVEVVDVHRRLAVALGDRPGRGRGSCSAGPLGPEHAHRERDARRASRCLAVATDLGVDLLVRSATRTRAVLGALADGAAPSAVSEAAAEIVRVESGRPRFGREMTTATIPQEAGINERAVSFTKGCYIGQETVARLHYKGKPNRHLRGLRLAAPAGARRSRCAWASASSGRSARPSSPPPAARSRSRSCAARPSPAPRSRSATATPPRSSRCRSEHPNQHRGGRMLS